MAAARADAHRWISNCGADFFVFLAIVGAYLLPGLLGHDPWKQDETYIFGIIHHMLQSGDYVVPTMAGEPFMEKPPLFYWVAAFLAQLLSPWLPLHDGARLATGVFMAVTCGAIGWTARHWWGQGYGRVAVMALLSCFGLVWYAHLMLTDVPVLTGFAVATAGLALCRERALAGGVVLSVGVGIGFLGKGVIAPGVIGIVALLLPLLFREWRSRTYFQALAVSFVACLPWLLVWPIALYLRSQTLFMDWFWLNNVGRFLGFSVAELGAPHTPGYWYEALPTMTFPALPLACVTLWQKRREILTQPPIQYSLLMFGVFMGMLISAASARHSYILPALAPVALMAAPAAVALPKWCDRLFDWSGRVLFGVLALCIWGVWVVLYRNGSVPDSWSAITRVLPQHFNPPLDFNTLFVAPFLSVAAVILVLHYARKPGRGLMSWTLGLTLCWGLATSLWLEWVDYAKSYRSVYMSMAQALPEARKCIASEHLGESERGMLDYMLGVVTRRQETDPTYTECDVLLLGGRAGIRPDVDYSRWSLIWDGARPGDTNERLWLLVERRALGMAKGAER